MSFIDAPHTAEHATALCALETARVEELRCQDRLAAIESAWRKGASAMPSPMDYFEWQLSRLALDKAQAAVDSAVGASSGESSKAGDVKGTPHAPRLDAVPPTRTSS